LRGFGCDQVQGFLVSKPLPVGELIDFLLKVPGCPLDAVL